jgi:hypothetical protein
LVGVLVLLVSLASEFIGMALGLSLGWILVCALIGMTVENLLVWLTVHRFNRRFPEGSAERQGAVALMARWNSKLPAAQRIRLAICPSGPESAPEAQVQAALDQLAGAPAASSTVPGDPSPLHLGHAAASPGKKAPHPAGSGPGSLIPLEFSDRHDPAGPKPAADAQPLFLPIEALDNPVEEGKPQPP